MVVATVDAAPKLKPEAGCADAVVVIIGPFGPPPGPNERPTVVGVNEKPADPARAVGWDAVAAVGAVGFVVPNANALLAVEVVAGLLFAPKLNTPVAGAAVVVEVVADEAVLAPKLNALVAAVEVVEVGAELAPNAKPPPEAAGGWLAAVDAVFDPTANENPPGAAED